MEKDKNKRPFNVLSKKGFMTMALAGVMAVTPFMLTGCGKDGVNGKDGSNGQDGTIIKSGLDYSEFTNAKIGDFFIDTNDYILYQKTATGWTVVMENYGRPGGSGDDGSKWYSGDGAPTSQGKVGDFYLNLLNHDIYEKKESGWVLIGNIDDSNEEEVEASKQIGNHYMISDGLTEMAANAVELVVDDNTGIAYAVYLASETTLGEATQLVKIAKFNIMQPTNVEWIEVFNRATDFGGQPLLECNIIDVSSTKVRVFAVNKSTWKYYYKDVDKKTNQVGELKEVKFKTNESSDPVEFSKSSVNQYISSISGTAFNELQITTKILNVDGYFYTTAVGGAGTRNVLFLKSTDGDTWTVQSVINNTTNYEAMLEYHNNKFWVMCRNGGTTPSNNKQQNLMYSEDGITWTKSNLALETSDTRPYLFKYQGDLYLAYSSPMSTDYSTIRTWRCNIHVGRIVSGQDGETFEEIVYKESKYGIVYYALTDWYGNMIMLYSSGEMHPTEGLMGTWSQGKDCLNYTIIHQQEPELSFKTLDSISIIQQPNITEYAVGDTFSSEGLVVRARYSDGTYNTVTNYTLSIPDMTTAGTKTITVAYTVNSVAKTATFDITVSEIEKELSSIEIVSKPTKVRYVLNEEFSSEGLVVQANYNVGAPEIITTYTLSTPDMTQIGTQPITITYVEDGITQTITFNIEISEEISTYNKLPSIQSNGTQYINTGYTTSANTKVVVRMEKPDNSGVTGGKWLFSSAEGSVRNFGFCIKENGAYVLDFGGTRYQTGTINWQEGDNTITIGNGEFTINDTILVNGLNVTGTPSTSINPLYFLQSPTSTNNSYLAGIIYEISVYEGDTLAMHLIPAQRIEDNRIGFYDTVGEKFVFSVTNEDFTEGPEEVVKVLSEITVQEDPTTTQYAVNETFNPEGLRVKATFEDGSYKYVNDYVLSTPDMTTAGTKTITVTYELNGVTKTTTFDIVVSDVQKELTSIQIITNPTKVTYEVGQEFSSEGLSVQANYNIGTPAIITNYTLSTPDMTQIGTQIITITYVEDGVTQTVDFEIIVNEKSYRELTSIVADGTQYIDTGYTTKSNTKIVIEMDKPNDEDLTGGKWLFNSTGSTSNRNFGFNVKPSGAYVLDYGNTRYQTGTINWQEGKNTITIGNGEFTINDTDLVTGLNVTTTPSTSLGTLWFLTAASSDSESYFVTTIYKISIYEGDTLVMNLIPAQRVEDNKIGFYDTVGEKFILSKTTADFTAGIDGSQE